VNISTDSAILMSIALFFILISSFFAFKTKPKKLKYLFIFLTIFNIFLIIYDLTHYIFPELINGTIIVVAFSSWAFLLVYGLISLIRSKSFYFIGFSKGFGILAIVAVFLGISSYFFGEDIFLEQILAYLATFYLVWRGVRKHKLSRGWLFLTAFIGTFALPFFYGYEKLVSNRKLNEK
jgi:hypothetical protein